MTTTPAWHAGPDLLVDYVAGTATRTRAASVEAHLLSCAACRAEIAPLAATDRLERNLAVITDRVDIARAGRAERFMCRLGVPNHVAKVVAVGPSERVSWLTGIAVALLVALAFDSFGGSESSAFAFLVAAPILPLAGVTSSVSFRTDPLGELVTATPTPAMKVFLMRALTVLAPTLVVVAAASVLVPDAGLQPALWLLPSLGLTSTALALGSVLPLRTVTWALGSGWVTAASIAARGTPRSELVDSFAAFRPAGQLVLLLASLIAAFVVTRRRDAFEFLDVGRTA